MERNLSEFSEVRDIDRDRSVGAERSRIVSKRLIAETPIIDAQNGQQIFEAMRDVIVSESKVLWIIDFSAVRFMDSAAVSALARLMHNPSVSGRLRIEGACAELIVRWPSIFGMNTMTDSNSWRVNE